MFGPHHCILAIPYSFSWSENLTSCQYMDKLVLIFHNQTAMLPCVYITMVHIISSLTKPKRGKKHFLMSLNLTFSHANGKC